MRHQDVAPGFIHTPFNWIVADATARGALTGLTSGDVNKVALQLSDASLWVLADADGTWTQVSGGSAPGTIPTLDAIPAPVADVGLNQKKLTNVGDATNARDAVNLETADGRYVTPTTASSQTAGWVAVLDGTGGYTWQAQSGGGGGGGAVDSVNGQTGVVELDAADVGADPAGAADSAVATEASRAETAEGLALQKASNLSDLANVSTARSNLGLGSASTTDSTAYDAAGTATAVKTAGATLVNHGSTASTARPSGWGFVIWVGSVQPTNIQTQDLWVDTSS